MSKEGKASIWKYIITGIVTLLVAGLIVPITSNYTAKKTVQLSVDKFYKERMWEEKINAYKEIFASLNKCKRICKREIERNNINKAFNKEYKFNKNVTLEYYKAYSNLREKIDLGHYLISDESLDCLNKLLNSQIIPQDSITNFNYSIEEVCVKPLVDIVKCLEELKEKADRDLRLDIK